MCHQLDAWNQSLRPVVAATNDDDDDDDDDDYVTVHLYSGTSTVVQYAVSVYRYRQRVVSLRTLQTEEQ